MRIYTKIMATVLPLWEPIYLQNIRFSSANSALRAAFYMAPGIRNQLDYVPANTMHLSTDIAQDITVVANILGITLHIFEGNQLRIINNRPNQPTVGIIKKNDAWHVVTRSAGQTPYLQDPRLCPYFYENKLSPIPCYTIADGCCDTFPPPVHIRCNRHKGSANYYELYLPNPSGKSAPGKWKAFSTRLELLNYLGKQPENGAGFSLVLSSGERRYFLPTHRDIAGIRFKTSITSVKTYDELKQLTEKTFLETFHENASALSSQVNSLAENRILTTIGYMLAGAALYNNPALLGGTLGFRFLNNFINFKFPNSSLSQWCNALTQSLALETPTGASLFVARQGWTYAIQGFLTVCNTMGVKLAPELSARLVSYPNHLLSLWMGYTNVSTPTTTCHKIAIPVLSTHDLTTEFTTCSLNNGAETMSSWSLKDHQRVIAAIDLRYSHPAMTRPGMAASTALQPRPSPTLELVITVPEFDSKEKAEHFIKSTMDAFSSQVPDLPEETKTTLKDSLRRACDPNLRDDCFSPHFSSRSGMKMIKYGLAITGCTMFVLNYQAIISSPDPVVAPAPPESSSRAPSTSRASTGSQPHTQSSELPFKSLRSTLMGMVGFRASREHFDGGNSLVAIGSLRHFLSDPNVAAAYSVPELSKALAELEHVYVPDAVITGSVPFVTLMEHYPRLPSMPEPEKIRVFNDFVSHNLFKANYYLDKVYLVGISLDPDKLSPGLQRLDQENLNPGFKQIVSSFFKVPEEFAMEVRTCRQRITDLQPDESLIMALGSAEIGREHAVLIRVTKLVAGEANVEIINTGDGAQNHGKDLNYFRLRYTNVPLDSFLDIIPQLLYQKVVKKVKNPEIQSLGNHHQYGMDGVYHALNTLPRKHLFADLQGHPQHEGNCWAYAPLVWLRARFDAHPELAIALEFEYKFKLVQEFSLRLAAESSDQEALNRMVLQSGLNELEVQFKLLTPATCPPRYTLSQIQSELEQLKLMVSQGSPKALKRDFSVRSAADISKSPEQLFEIPLQDPLPLITTAWTPDSDLKPIQDILGYRFDGFETRLQSSFTQIHLLAPHERQNFHTKLLADLNPLLDAFINPDFVQKITTWTDKSHYILSLSKLIIMLDYALLISPELDLIFPKYGLMLRTLNGQNFDELIPFLVIHSREAQHTSIAIKNYLRLREEVRMQLAGIRAITPETDPSNYIGILGVTMASLEEIEASSEFRLMQDSYTSQKKSTPLIDVQYSYPAPMAMGAILFGLHLPSYYLKFLSLVHQFRVFPCTHFEYFNKGTGIFDFGIVTSTTHTRIGFPTPGEYTTALQSENRVLTQLPPDVPVWISKSLQDIFVDRNTQVETALDTWLMLIPHLETHLWPILNTMDMAFLQLFTHVSGDHLSALRHFRVESGTFQPHKRHEEKVSEIFLKIIQFFDHPQTSHVFLACVERMTLYLELSESRQPKVVSDLVRRHIEEKLQPSNQALLEPLVSLYRRFGYTKDLVHFRDIPRPHFMVNKEGNSPLHGPLHQWKHLVTCIETLYQCGLTDTLAVSVVQTGEKTTITSEDGKWAIYIRDQAEYDQVVHLKFDFQGNAVTGVLGDQAELKKKFPLLRNEPYVFFNVSGGIVGLDAEGKLRFKWNGGIEFAARRYDSFGKPEGLSVVEPNSTAHLARIFHYDDEKLLKLTCAGLPLSFTPISDAEHPNTYQFFSIEYPGYRLVGDSSDLVHIQSDTALIPERLWLHDDGKTHHYSRDRHGIWHSESPDGQLSLIKHLMKNYDYHQIKRQLPYIRQDLPFSHHLYDQLKLSELIFHSPTQGPVILDIVAIVYESVSQAQYHVRSSTTDHPMLKQLQEYLINYADEISFYFGDTYRQLAQYIPEPHTLTQLIALCKTISDPKLEALIAVFNAALAAHPPRQLALVDTPTLLSNPADKPFPLFNYARYFSPVSMAPLSHTPPSLLGDEQPSPHLAALQSDILAAAAHQHSIHQFARKGKAKLIRDLQGSDDAHPPALGNYPDELEAQFNRIIAQSLPKQIADQQKEIRIIDLLPAFLSGDFQHYQSILSLLTKADHQRLEFICHNYMIEILKWAQLQQVKGLLKQDHSEQEIGRILSSTLPMAETSNPRLYRAMLTQQFLKYWVFTADQLNTVAALSDPKSSAITQLRTGAGKTTVVTPLLILLETERILGDSKAPSLVSVIVPEHLFIQEVSTIASAIHPYGKTVKTIPISRNGDCSVAALAHRLDTLTTAQKNGDVILMTPETFESYTLLLHNWNQELLIAVQNPVDRLRYHLNFPPAHIAELQAKIKIVADIVTALNGPESVRIIDESDTVLQGVDLIFANGHHHELLPAYTESIQLVLDMLRSNPDIQQWIQSSPHKVKQHVYNGRLAMIQLLDNTSYNEIKPILAEAIFKQLSEDHAELSNNHDLWLQAFKGTLTDTSKDQFQLALDTLYSQNRELAQLIIQTIEWVDQSLPIVLSLEPGRFYGPVFSGPNLPKPGTEFAHPYRDVNRAFGEDTLFQNLEVSVGLTYVYYATYGLFHEQADALIIHLRDQLNKEFRAGITDGPTTLLLARILTPDEFKAFTMSKFTSRASRSNFVMKLRYNIGAIDYFCKHTIQTQFKPPIKTIKTNTQPIFHSKGHLSGFSATHEVDYGSLSTSRDSVQNGIMAAILASDNPVEVVKFQSEDTLLEAFISQIKSGKANALMDGAGFLKGDRRRIAEYVANKAHVQVRFMSENGMLSTVGQSKNVHDQPICIFFIGDREGVDIPGCDPAITIAGHLNIQESLVPKTLQLIGRNRPLLKRAAETMSTDNSLSVWMFEEDAIQLNQLLKRPDTHPITQKEWLRVMLKKDETHFTQDIRDLTLKQLRHCLQSHATDLLISDAQGTITLDLETRQLISDLFSETFPLDPYLRHRVRPTHGQLNLMDELASSLKHLQHIFGRIIDAPTQAQLDAVLARFKARYIDTHMIKNSYTPSHNPMADLSQQQSESTSHSLSQQQGKTQERPRTALPSRAINLYEHYEHRVAVDAYQAIPLTKWLRSSVNFDENIYVSQDFRFTTVEGNGRYPDDILKPLHYIVVAPDSVGRTSYIIVSREEAGYLVDHTNSPCVHVSNLHGSSNAVKQLQLLSGHLIVDSQINEAIKTISGDPRLVLSTLAEWNAQESTA